MLKWSTNASVLKFKNIPSSGSGCIIAGNAGRSTPGGVMRLTSIPLHRNRPNAPVIEHFPCHIIYSSTMRTLLHALPLPVLVVAGLILLQAACTQTENRIPMTTADSASLHSEMYDATIYSYDGAHKKWMLKSEVLRRSMGDTGTVLAYPVKLWLYDSLGRPNSRVLADSGHTNDARDRFEVWGNVYVKNQDSLEVKAQRLSWSQKTRKITSNQYVQIETPKGDILRGSKLDATESFSRFSLTGDVSGKFPNFKQRAESEEGFLQ
ncbi:MAG: LPS export ABC transporter periplasmic protein LptC [Chitinivibrionales bacterium]|nr:LPS export ABC transporter periplasmic protein LptC [Chitinivibrionales bacterium]